MNEGSENLTALSRDTKNANQRVEKQDLQKVQERQEIAKVIGDISNNAISIATYNEREKINKLGLEKFKLEEQEKALKGQAGNEQQLAAIKQQLTNVQADITKTQDKIDRTYGIGSEKGMAIRAVTAALQATAQNDTAGSLVALASPYLNQKIHEMTAGDTAKDKETNLMAHALLSAVEFQVTGKDPLTGAVAGGTGEVTAQILTQAIYNKTPNQLTANEKENISTLSQLAGGLAAALTAKANGTTTEQGGNFLAATSGAGTAKRAVENNYLSKSDWQSYEKEVTACKNDGKCIDRVKKKFSEINQDNSLALKNACRLGGSLSECRSHTSAAKEGLSYARANIPFDVTSIWQANIMRTTKKDSEIKPTKGLIGSEAINKLESLAANEKFRAELKQDPKKLKEFITVVDQATLNARTEKGNAYEFGALHDYPNIGSLAGYQYFGSELPLEPVHPELLLIGGGMAKGATTTAKFLNSVITPSTKVTVGVNGIASVVGQYVVDGEITPKQVLWDMTEARITKDFNYKKFALWSASSGFVEGYMQNGKVDDGVDKSLSKLSTSSFGYFVGKKFEKYIDPKFNTYGDGFKTEKIGSNGMMERYVPPSVMPTGIGNAIDNISNKNFDYILENGKIYYGEGTK